MDQKEQVIARSEYRNKFAHIRTFYAKDTFPDYKILRADWCVNKECKIVKRKPPAWQNHRKTALPPYSDKEIQYYKEKLIKFKLVYPDILDPKHEYYWEAKHCQEVLDSHQRLLDMEHKNNNKLHDDQDSSSIRPSDKKC